MHLLLLLVACGTDQKLDHVDDDDDDDDTSADTDTGDTGDTEDTTPPEPELVSVALVYDAGGTAITTREVFPLAVVATFDDGSEADVTADASVVSSDEAVLRFYVDGVGQPLDAGTTTVSVQVDLLGGVEFDPVDVTVTVVPAESGDLSINELLADPAVGADVNGDGASDPVDDEFVEITNAADVTVDVSGVTLWDADLTTARHTFPEGTILHAGEALVVFGGGTPPASGPHVTCAVATNEDVGLQHGLALNNEGDVLVVESAAGELIAAFAYGEGGDMAAIDDASFVLDPEVFGTSWTHHGYATGSIGAQSPGTFVDGSAFPGPDGRYAP